MRQTTERKRDYRERAGIGTRGHRRKPNLDAPCTYADPRVRGTGSPECAGAVVSWVPHYFIGPGPNNDGHLYLCEAHTKHHAHLVLSGMIPIVR